MNVAEGLELHEAVLTPAEQAQLVQAVEHWVALVRCTLRLPSPVGDCNREEWVRFWLGVVCGPGRRRWCRHWAVGWRAGEP